MFLHVHLLYLINDTKHVYVYVLWKARLCKFRSTQMLNYE